MAEDKPGRVLGTGASGDIDNPGYVPPRMRVAAKAAAPADEDMNAVTVEEFVDD